MAGLGGNPITQAGGGQATAGGGLGGSSLGGSIFSEAGASPSGTGGQAEAGAGGSLDGGASAGGAAEAGAGGSDDSGAPFAGICGHGWAAAGAPHRPALRGNVTPSVDKSGNWSFVWGRYRFVVAGARGALITELSIDGVNLVDPSGGSTFWPSPQQAYTWPPPAELDSKAYTAAADESSLTLSSAVAKTLGLSVRKRFTVNAASGVITIDYELVNEGKTSASWAPWEVTRVRAGGYTFAPKGPGNRTISQDSFQHPLPLSLLPPPPEAGGIEWLDYPSLASKLTLDNYINEFDGAEGWLAHADRLGRTSLPVLLVKSFVDAPDARLPTNQAEVQLWTSG
ncbi:MAG TPA: hypothetical protein VEQ59_10175, partial [Polyangiaceae bacterium]|nr:hypothetical protein [Polyangiaceae bacterium]